MTSIADRPGEMITEGGYELGDCYPSNHLRDTMLLEMARTKIQGRTTHSQLVRDCKFIGVFGAIQIVDELLVKLEVQSGGCRRHAWHKEVVSQRASPILLEAKETF